MIIKILRKLVWFIFPVFFVPLRWLDRYFLSELAHWCRRTDYITDPAVIKTFHCEGVEAKAHIQSYFDRWRIDEFESYPVRKIKEYMNHENNRNKKVAYYEIGANIGYSVITMGKILGETGHVVAFELEPTNFKTLNDNIILNQLENTIPLQIGIADQSRITKFYYNRYHDKASIFPSSGVGMHSLDFNEKVHEPHAYYQVPLMPLDTVIREFHLPFPTHIFIDAYGAEDFITGSMHDTLNDCRLKMVMVDIESKALEESKSHQRILDAGFSLLDCDTEEAQDVVPVSHKTTYIR